MSESVGKISLDIDLQSGLNKQIRSTANHIGKQLSSQIQNTMKRQMQGIGKTMSFSMPKKAFEMPKKTYSTKPMQDENNYLAQTLNNLNAKMVLQQQKLAELNAQYNRGFSEKIKQQIAEQSKIMQVSETRIEALRVKLADLKETYEVMISPERKNKIVQEIARTEAQMMTLIARSDKALQKITELEDGMASEKRNALREKIVNTESSLISLGQRAEKIKQQLNGANNSINNVGNSAKKTEKPVRRLGMAFFSTEKRANSMTNSFVAGFKRIARQVLVFAVIYKAIRGLQSYIGSAMKTNDQFTHSLNQVKTNLQVAFMPIFEVIMPALQAFMNFLAKVTAYIAAFISAIFGKTYQQAYKATQGLNNARAAMDGFGASSKKAAKEAQKAHKQLASFDEINTLGDKDSNVDAGGLGGAGAGGIAQLTPPDMDVSGIQKKMDSLVVGIKRTFDGAWQYVKNGWQWTVDTFGSAFKQAWTMVSSELQNWKAHFGIMFQDISSLGRPLANIFHEYVVPLWQEGILLSGEILSGFLESSRMIMESLWQVVFSTFEIMIVEGLPVLFEFMQDIQNIFSDLFLLTKQIFDDIWMGIIDPAIQIIGQIIQDGLHLIFGWWKDWGKQIVNSLKDSLQEVRNLWTNLWNNFLKPIISEGLKFLSSIWNKYLKEIVIEVINLVGKLISSAQEIFNKFILPIVNWLVQKLGPIFTTVFKGIVVVVSGLIGVVAEVAKGVIKALGGIIDFLTGVFTGNWRKAWQGVKDIFKGIADSLVAVIKAPINGIIGLINGAIRGLNRIRIPSWVPGVGGMGINIPEIPKLAKGGIIDQPTLAMVGEAGKEAVMPLENNTGWINNLAGQIANQMGGSSGTSDESITLLRQIVDVLLKILNAILNNDTEAIFKIGETEFGRAAIKAINNVQRQAGETLLEV